MARTRVHLPANELFQAGEGHFQGGHLKLMTPVQGQIWVIRSVILLNIKLNFDHHHPQSWDFFYIYIYIYSLPDFKMSQRENIDFLL